MASKSGKLTSDHFKTWLKDVYIPNVGSLSVLLIDLWSGHCSVVVWMKGGTLVNKDMIAKLIPTGTGKIWPVDVYGFRVWKNDVRHFSDSVILMNEDLNLHMRNNIIKFLSLVHNQFSSPQYFNLFTFSWYKSGYIEEKPRDFENPVQFGFGYNSDVRCETEGCCSITIKGRIVL
ncbi:LOW QUALITY PROTEIN: uncharacterized protein LOC111674006 [Orussus abietinus]|uniref:LOW QUALITY PROTEIN: uncharacterized protein LOC111674006 n=1 Tax=Orussus abietinus TaxID=222816 RepID=UPI000C7161B4|nr:LOW QUALITY PROTEIN: uncharacterized protein LOC111674006 [Orussus abietinus]